MAPGCGGRRLGRRLRLRLARCTVDPCQLTQAADPAARLLAVDGPYADLDNDGERHVIEEWRRHIAPFQNLEQLTAAAGRSAAGAAALDEAVRTARRFGASWADIGRATGMSHQSANERWSSWL